MRKWFTANCKGEIGCHDCDRATAEADLAIMQEKYPDEEWEMFCDDEEERS